MKTSSRNIALLIITALLTMCLAGCRDKALNARLDTCDSLLVASPGEAYGRLSAMRDSVERHAGKRDRMRFYLLLAQAQNKTDRNILGTDTLKSLTRFFSRPNDKMMAYYMLGSKYRDLGDAPNALENFLNATNEADTTSGECNYELLGVIYSHIAMVYHQQRYPSKELESWKMAARMAEIAHDKWLHAECMAFMSSSYANLGDSVKAFHYLQKGYDCYMKAGMPEYAAGTRIVFMDYYLQRGDLKNAMKSWNEYKDKSGLFDSTGQIKSGKETAYLYLARLFEKSSQLDSAVFYYRKTVVGHPNLMAKENYYRGLMGVYHRLNRSDSVFKYARLYADANDSANLHNSANEVSRIAGIYNYSEAQRQLLNKVSEAERLHLIIFSITLFFIIFISFIVLLFKARIKKEREQVKLSNQTYYNLLQEYSSLMEELDYLKTNQDKLILNLGKLKKEKEEKIAALQSELSAYYGNMNVSLWEDQYRLYNHTIVKQLHDQATKGMEISDCEWNELEKYIAKTLPDFHNFVLSYESNMTINDYKVCMLTKLHFIPSEILVLLHVSKQQVSNIRSKLNKLLFNEKGTKNFDSNIQKI